MDAKLQKIQITPVKLDSEGNVARPQAAVIALEVPIDSTSQKEEIIGLLDVLTNEWLKVTITEKQLRLDLAEGVAETSVERTVEHTGVAFGEPCDSSTA